MQIVATDNATNVMLGMSTSDFITLISAIIVGGGTIALAVMTYKSTKKMTVVQQNQLLTEIIDWSIRLVEITSESFLDIAKAFKEEGSKFLSILFDQISARETALDIMKGKYKHISETAENLPDSLKPKDLQAAVKELLKEFDAYKMKLVEWKTSITKEQLSRTEPAIAKVYKPMDIGNFIMKDLVEGQKDINRNLENAANKVISEATKAQRRVIE